MSESQQRPKRRKLNGGYNHTEIPEHIESVEDLQSSLLFRQSSSLEAKHGIAKFKEFLQSIARPDEVSDQSQRLKILKSYCQEQSQVQTANSSCLRDLLSSWSFAIEVGQEPLLSVIPSVIALFLKTISFHIEFRELGIALCKCLLEKDQLRLFDRGLTANRTKEHLISPCIRLLTEVVGFDGGSVASRVFNHRDITFKRLDNFLEQRKAKSDEGRDAGDKPTLRRIAQRYVLRNLAFQDFSTKRELITEGRLFRAFLYNIRFDAADIIIDILQAIERHIVEETQLSRSLKARFFDLPILQSIATLYTFKPTGDGPSVEPSIPQRVHALLMKLCTDSSHGVLLRQSGWYPPGQNLNAPLHDEASGAIDLGLDSTALRDAVDDSRPVTNLKISRFLQSLHPESDTVQGELVLATFKAAPELVADYFSHKSSFNMEPKATPEWLSQAAWLFRCVQLPVPDTCGRADGLPGRPPPISIMLENILPQPLDRETLTRCMNLNLEVVTLFATRLLVVAFQKLRDVTAMLAGASIVSQLWPQAAARLKTQFGQRIPLVKDVIAAFQRNGKGARNLRSSATDLIAWYYEMLPELAMHETFNISSALSDILMRLLSERQNPSASDDLEELHMLTRIGVRLPHVRWWNKIEGQDLSCFTCILRAVSLAQIKQNSAGELRKNLHIVAQEYGIMGENVAQLNALISSLQPADSSHTATSVFEFLDNCITRLAKALVHYYDLACQYFERERITEVPDLLAAAILEQWPFVCQKQDTQAQAEIAQWIARYLGSLTNISSLEHDLDQLRMQLMDQTESETVRSLVLRAFKDDVAGMGVGASDESQPEAQKDIASHIEQNVSEKIQEPSILQDWRSKLSSQQALPPRKRLDLEDLESALNDNLLKTNICLLCSQQEDVRLQSLNELSRFQRCLHSASNRNWRLLSVLVGEVVETAKESGLSETPLPSVVAQFACRFLDVLTDPLHLMYAKVNRFLNKGPVWERKKIVTYWIDKVILKDSEGGDSKLSEINWLLAILVQGLQAMQVSLLENIPGYRMALETNLLIVINGTKQDLELYRHASVFERVISLCDVPTTKDSMRERILELIFRAAEIGGSQMIATRMGILTWLKIQAIREGPNQAITGELLRLVQSRCDSEQLDSWKGVRALK